MSAANPRIVILTADTGGGHRSVSEALVEAFQEIGQTNLDMVDIFKYVPWPFNQLPKTYLPTINRAAWLWRIVYKLTATRSFGALYLKTFVYWLTRGGMRRLFREHAPDLVISTHPIFQYMPARVLRAVRPGIPFVTMVTDFASAHPWWFTPLTDLCLVPSEALRQVAMQHGIPPKKIYVTGLPVQRAFSLNRYITRQEARRALGLQERPTVLMVGGGEGMGTLDKMAIKLDQQMPELQKLIIAGRNQKLEARLKTQRWLGPTHVYGFVRNMPQLMRAADMIVTKAGPSTLSEALICGLPILLSGFVPGQEEGNVKFILDHQAGCFLQKPAADVGRALKEIMADGGARLTQLAHNAYALGRPDAAREAVRLIMQLYQIANS